MPEARYFLPDHPDLKGEYSRDDLRILLKSGKLSRSDMVMDDETGLAHLLGALLVSPYYLSPHHGDWRGNNAPEEDEKDHEELAVAGKKTTASAAEVMEDEPGENDEENGAAEPVEFRATTPLRQWESPALEVDHYGEEQEEQEEEEIEEEEYEEEEDAHRESGEAPVPQPHPVFQASMPQEEELLFHGHPSWLSYPKALTGFIVLSAASVLCQRLHFGLAWCVTAAAVALLCLAFAALDRMTTEYFITSRRVELESGLIGRSTKEIRIADIRAIDVTQKGFNAVVGVGTLDFFSSAGGQADVCFADVYRPHRLKQIVRDLQA